ncbi:aminotransferase class I/II-fold pyridoxal phosphate-dependent enzyme [Puniceicoccaceae bacterium K14]|nr:aminotransferase class I/II-fold pyridoxal phosphate-dependent enzyme [Puniceicoccaceae bacterium K14]
MTSKYNHIPVMKPLLPTVDKIAPYLSEIDNNRWYSNFGPLVVSLEERLEEYMGLERGTVALVSSATSGLTMALQALGCKSNSSCAMPSWTFIATAAAARNAELTPHFVDVDPDSWAINPADVLPIKNKISAVVPVAPFGSAIKIEEWENFSNSTGIPVVVDAASCFDSFSQQKDFRISEIPVVLSLHATKAFACGEGGMIVCKNKELISRFKSMSNFGFIGEDAITGGGNSKLSEYSAAVGHAELDSWESKRSKFAELGAMYREKLGRVGVEYFASDKWISPTISIKVEQENTFEVARMMSAEGVDTRRWWRQGCHYFEAFHECPREDLKVTEGLVKSVLGLPLWIGMREWQVDRVVERLENTLRLPVTTAMGF